MRVTVRAEWDMGHRLPNHDGQCRHLHGHRYVAEVSFEGEVDAREGAPTQGMVADFGALKAAMRAEIEKLDHRFLIYDQDPLLQEMRQLPGVVAVAFVPTAENLALALLAALRPAAPAGVWVATVVLYETPTSRAEARNDG